MLPKPGHSVTDCIEILWISVATTMLKSSNGTNPAPPLKTTVQNWPSPTTSKAASLWRPTPTTSLPLKTGLAASSGARYARNVKYWQISSFYLALYLALLSASRPTNINKKLDSLLRLVTSMQKEKRMKRIEFLWTY